MGTDDGPTHIWRELHRRAAVAYDGAAAAVDEVGALTPATDWTAGGVMAHVREDHGDGEARPIEDLMELQMMTLDLAVHTWDLARSQGRQPSADEELCTVLHETFAPFTEAMAQDGAFAPPVAVDGDASPRDRLVALCGRDPSWTLPASQWG